VGLDTSQPFVLSPIQESNTYASRQALLVRLFYQEVAKKSGMPGRCSPCDGRWQEPSRFGMPVVSYQASRPVPQRLQVQLTSHPACQRWWGLACWERLPSELWRRWTRSWWKSPRVIQPLSSPPLPAEAQPFPCAHQVTPHLLFHLSRT